MLTRRECAEILRVKPATLATWACRGTGPRLSPVKVHGRILYNLSDVEALLHGSPEKGVGNG